MLLWGMQQKLDFFKRVNSLFVILPNMCFEELRTHFCTIFEHPKLCLIFEAFILNLCILGDTQNKHFLEIKDILIQFVTD